MKYRIGLALSLVVLSITVTCFAADGLTTKAKLDETRWLMSQKGKALSRDDIVGLLGTPLKSQRFFGILYMIYETDNNEQYLVQFDEGGRFHFVTKLEKENSEWVEKIFRLKTDERGIPLDKQGYPMNFEAPKAEDPHEKPSGRNAWRARGYFMNGMFTYRPTKEDELRAVSDFNKAIEMDPNWVGPYEARADVYKKHGYCHQAMMDYEKCTELTPQHPKYMQMAEALLTCTNPEDRDGQKALEYAQRAIVVASAWQDESVYVENARADRYHILAGAYAQVGEFDKAIAMEQKALDMYKAINGQDRNLVYKELLETYKNKRTYYDWKTEKEKSGLRK